MLSQFFIHPGMAAVGLGLIAIPIVIHLINRLQYRRVRFAAMEFLLQSQQRNRRRLLLEQLLLLLLRILMVLLLVGLFARLILDQSQLALLERPETHHIVLLDDSGSMQDRWADTSAYQQGLAVVKQLASDLTNQEGLQTLTLLTASAADTTNANFTQREIDLAMIGELEDKLESLEKQCGYGRVRWSDTFAALDRIIESTSAPQTVVHLISDFRTQDWSADPARQSELESLASENVLVNLVPAVPARHANIGIRALTGQVQTAAVNVPLSLQAELTNHSEALVENVAVRVLVDDVPLPQAITIPEIEPGDTVTETFEVTFTEPGEHAVTVQIPADALAIDNARFLTLNVPERQRVLIADGTPGFTEAAVVNDALAADPGVTGIEVVIVDPDDVRDQDLSQFTALYLLNVPRLTADTRALLEEYVANGGGLVWFLGDRIDAEFYGELAASAAPVTDSADGAETSSGTRIRLFPVRPQNSPVELATDETNPGADLELTDHPLFQFLNASDGLLAYYIDIARYFEAVPAEDDPQVAVIGRLRNQAPLFFEVQGQPGRVLAVFTAVGPMTAELETRWHNWPLDVNAPSFTVFHLELVKYLSSQRGKRPARLINTPLELLINPALYAAEVTIDPPAGEGVASVVVQAVPTETAAQDSSDDQPLLRADWTDTRLPGVYRITRETISRTPETELLSFNIPAEEGALALTTPDALRTEFAAIDFLQVQDFGSLEGIAPADPGKELRTLLLVLFVIVVLAEQALAYRLSFHVRGTGSRPRGATAVSSAAPLRPSAAGTVGGSPA